jgi:hypothetical protein
MKRLFILFGLVLFFLPMANGQSQIVRQQVERVDEILRYDGYTRTHDVEYASLRDDASDYYTLDLRKGYTYKIVAVCDADCSDMDLKIYDENGNLIDEDTESDDTPIVNVTPKWTGEYELYVKMYDCSINPCGFGIVVYGK